MNAGELLTHSLSPDHATRQAAEQALEAAALQAAADESAMAALTAVLISVNWLIYVWAVTNGRAIETAFSTRILLSGDRSTATSMCL